MRSEDEVYVKAIAGARTVPHRNGAGIMVVTVDHSATAIIAMNSPRWKVPEITSVICEA